MTRPFLLRTPLVLALLALGLAACDSASFDSSALAPTVDVKPAVLSYPGENPGPPFYANFDATAIITDDDVVGILFMRDPSCVPADFNLLVGFNAAASDCDLTVEGRLWIKPDDPFPYQIQQWGDGVPVYFVDRAELDVALFDGVLTIGELEDLPSLLVGTTDHYREVVQNSSQGARDGHSVLNASGTLQDGRRFRFRYNESFDSDTGVRTFQTVLIDFR